MTFSPERGVARLAKGSRILFETDLVAVFSHVRFGDGLVAMTIAPDGASPGAVTFPGIRPERVVAVSLDGAGAHWTAAADGIRIGIAAPGRLHVHLVPEL